MIQADLFKKYDIRGRAIGENPPLNEAAAEMIGQAFGSYVLAAGQTKVVVGQDNRLSSPALAQAAIRGLTAAGCDVIDIDMVSTPVVYWYSITHGGIGGMMITGSHLEPDQNGFKLCIGLETLYDERIRHLLQRIVDKDFAYGVGTAKVDTGAREAYMVDIAARLTMPRVLKVVIDAGNGTGGLFGPELVQRWGHELIDCLYCEPDGRFPNHQPDPQKEKNMRALAERVRETGAEIGLAFDGDADRVGVVDEQGRIISADRVLALLAKDLLSRQPGATVLADVSCSQTVFDEIARAGGQPVMWMTGHSLVKAKMRELNAPLGGEISGHIFLGEDYLGYDDGFFAAGRLLQLVGGSSEPLSVLDDALVRYHSTPVYRPHCPPELMTPILDRLKAELSSAGEVSTIDGLRIRFDRGWGGIRASNTEPVLSMRFEGLTEADALRYRELFLDVLRRYPDVDLSEII